jgi:hypothetical protein
MRSLQSINRAQAEARYISRSWSNPSVGLDVPWEPVYSKPVESPDDIIQVCTINFMTLSGLGMLYIKRSEYEAEKAKFQAVMAFWNALHERKSK